MGALDPLLSFGSRRWESAADWERPFAAARDSDAPVRSSGERHALRQRCLFRGQNSAGAAYGGSAAIHLRVLDVARSFLNLLLDNNRVA